MHGFMHSPKVLSAMSWARGRVLTPLPCGRYQRQRREYQTCVINGGRLSTGQNAHFQPETFTRNDCLKKNVYFFLETVSNSNMSSSSTLSATEQQQQ